MKRFQCALGYQPLLKNTNLSFSASRHPAKSAIPFQAVTPYILVSPDPPTPPLKIRFFSEPPKY